MYMISTILDQDPTKIQGDLTWKINICVSLRKFYIEGNEDVWIKEVKISYVLSWE